MTNENTVTLKVVTPEGIALEEEMEFGRFPGKAGELGVYPSHSATLTELKEGFITVKTEKSTDYFFISKGYLHIRPDHVLLMTPTIERQTEIDKERAESSKKRAEERLNPHSDASTLDKDRARQSLLRAEERLHTLTLSN